MRVLMIMPLTKWVIEGGDPCDQPIGLPYIVKRHHGFIILSTKTWPFYSNLRKCTLIMYRIYDDMEPLRVI